MIYCLNGRREAENKRKRDLGDILIKLVKNNNKKRRYIRKEIITFKLPLFGWPFWPFHPICWDGKNGLEIIWNGLKIVWKNDVRMV